MKLCRVIYQKITTKSSECAKMLAHPTCERNKQPIADVLKQYIPSQATWNVLEVASGTGQHVAHFAALFPNCRFFPSDIEQSHLDSVRAHKEANKLTNIHEPVYFDVSSSASYAEVCKTFGLSSVDVVYNANMMHISSQAAVDGLFAFAGQMLRPSGLLVAYGPFAFALGNLKIGVSELCYICNSDVVRFDGQISPASNVNFDASLRKRNPEWGYRDVAQLKPLAVSNGLQYVRCQEMPANNHVLVFEKVP